MTFGKDQASNYGTGHGSYSVSKEPPIEEVNWRDTGCKLHPSCLNCPRPLCFYDEKESMAGRPASILSVIPDLESYVKTVGARSVAEAYRVSIRTVRRELARRRKNARTTNT